MSTSTDAILFYGIHADEGEWEGFKFENWEDVLAERNGVLDPNTPFESEDDKQIQRAYWDKKRAICNSNSCALGIHCSYECAMPYAYVKESKTLARRGYPEEISSLEVRTEWDASLKAFCELMGIPWSQPKWWLVSFWG